VRLQQLRANDIQLGMTLTFNVYDKNHMLLLSRNQLVANAELLRRNLERGMYAETTELEAARNARTSELRTNLLKSSVQARSPSAVELLRGVCSDLGSLLWQYEDVDEFGEGVRSNLETLLLSPIERGLFAGAVTAIATELQVVCSNDADDVIASILLDHAARYPIRHCVNTAILTELILSHIEPSADIRRSAVCAALTMNIAMLRLQETLYRQQAPMTAKQRAAVHLHATAGAAQLRDRGVIDENWLRAVAEHHEQIDGKGYARGLSGKQIMREAQIISIAERYCAMVSERAYRKPLLPNSVLKKLYLQGEVLNPSLVELLVKEIGIYPPGSYVKLASGEIALVVKRGAKAHQPRVRCIADSNSKKLYARPLRDTSERSTHVIGAIEGWTLDIEQDAAALCRSDAEAHA
jgi:HD-GYP domain-containing protein (c-di-GMP phosphodiesterase class II)